MALGSGEKQKLFTGIPLQFFSCLALLHMKFAHARSEIYGFLTGFPIIRISIKN